MKLDNFTTARCNKCHWIKQFQPGKEYDQVEFECNCGKPVLEAKPKSKAKTVIKPKQQTMEEQPNGESESTSKTDSES